MSLNLENYPALLTLSFDDGREDNYRIAYPILKKYNLTATFHIVTGWVDGSWNAPMNWYSAINGSMSINQIFDLYNDGFEISSHGDRHSNLKKDINLSIEKLNNWGINENGENFGFSSPNSIINPNNYWRSFAYLNSLGLSYIRIGSLRQSFSLSKRLIRKTYCNLCGFNNLDNVNNINYNNLKTFLLTSNFVTSVTSLSSVLKIIEDAIKKQKWSILVFHSILTKEDPGYGKDKWFWEYERFEKLCKILSEFTSRELLIVTLKKGIEYCKFYKGGD